MPSAGETLGQQSQMEATLDAGIGLISAQEQVVFTLYQKWTFSQDGYVFWIATSQTMTASGSLHYGTERRQDEDQTIAANQVILTSEQEITAFNVVAPNTMWIANWPANDGGTIQIAFSSRGPYFQQAGVWHYAGFAVYPALSAQIVTSALSLPAGLIVSNSLPIWLTRNSLSPVYPSFLVPDNVAPPYIVAHIESTEALGAFPVLGPWPGTTIPNSGQDPLHTLAAFNLVRDEVELTFYGYTNSMAIQWYQSLVDDSTNGIAPGGFANSPVISDSKRTQSEIVAIAQKKTMTILWNYYQGAADAVARRLLLSATPPNIQIIGGIPILLTGTLLTDASTMTGQGSISA